MEGMNASKTDLSKPVFHFWFCLFVCFFSISDRGIIEDGEGTYYIQPEIGHPVSK